MGDISFGQTVGMLKSAMDGASAANSAIANNIANVNTPNFRRTDVSFKEALAQSEASMGDPTTFSLTTNDPRQFSMDGAHDAQPFSITSTVDDAEQMRVDGSNVDVDQEMAKLSINSSYAQTMSQLLSNDYTRIRKAIEEQA